MSNKDDEIGDIKSKRVKRKAAKRKKKALFLESVDSEAYKQIHKISASVAWSFHEDEDDLTQIICMKMITESNSIGDVKNLKAWCYPRGRNICINKYKHRKVETAYQESTLRNILDVTKRGGKPWIQSTPVPTPEQELLIKEQEAIDQEQEAVKRAVLSDILREATASSPKWLVDVWVPGKSPQEIITETRKPAATVYRKLKEMQKAIVEAIEKYRNEHGL